MASETEDKKKQETNGLHLRLTDIAKIWHKFQQSRLQVDSRLLEC